MAQSVVRITEEKLAKILGLPEGVIVKNVAYEHKRGIVEVILHSEEPIKDITYLVAEGCEAPHI